MYRLLTIAVAAASCLGAVGVLPAQAAPPCFQQAKAFGEAVTAMGSLAGEISNPSPKVRQATDLRNQGMEACLAGRVREGRAMIEQATAMLKN